ncbi:MAG: PilZ domain-containing protein [Erythrobacter sp.]
MKARTTTRVPIDATGSYRTSRGMQWEIALSDLSEGGCRISDPRARLDLGQWVRLFIAGTGPHIAEVAWRRGEDVGLAFSRRLPERVFAKLTASDWSGAAEAMANSSQTGGLRRFV